jgi:hypothetical protein
MSIYSSCSKSAVKIPGDIISKDSMVFILMDVHIAEAGVKSLSADSLMINTKTYYEFIYKKHQITEEQFQKSMRFYTYQPELLQEIYVKMTEEMSKKEAEVNKFQP